jgi:integrase
MATLATTVDALIASREWDAATLARFAFWTDALGAKELADITPDDVDLALVRLAERGPLKPRRGKDTEAAGRPLAGSTVNRYISQLATVYKYARRLRLLPRAHVPPTRGLEKAPEHADPKRYLRLEEVERLVKVACLLDRRWGRLVAMILVAFHTGLRVGNLTQLRWRDVDLEQRTISVMKTKNGQPMISALSDRAAAELAQLPGQKKADALVFEGREGRPFAFRALWDKVGRIPSRPTKVLHSGGDLPTIPLSN